MRAPRKLGYLVLVPVLVATAGLAVVAQQPRIVDEGAMANAARTGEEWLSYNFNWMEQ